MLSSKYKEIIDREFAGENIDIDDTPFPPLMHSRGGKNPIIINKNVTKCPIHNVFLREGSACPLCEEEKKMKEIPEELKKKDSFVGRPAKYTKEEAKERQRMCVNRWRERNKDKQKEQSRKQIMKRRIDKGYHYLDTLGLKEGIKSFYK